ncbi:hypothetical protein [uncultured Porphyromonas sp.]|uniref:hypothetical protein n=1 Tax=uncultured Porphyromonas sp. TaxID=159274 RepID=UPI002623A539|nr:hypothetical protein [uncultured Porphyromonas sp.]
MTYLRALATMALTALILCGTISCNQEPSSNNAKDQLDSLQLAGTRWAGTITDEHTWGEPLNAPYGIIFFSPSNGQASFPLGYGSDSKYISNINFKYTIHSSELSFTTDFTGKRDSERGKAIDRFVEGKWLIMKATRDEIVLCRRPLTEIYINLKRVKE